MSTQWTTAQLRTTPLRLVRERATYDEIRRKRRRIILKEMLKPAIVGAALVVGFLMQTAGLHGDAVVIAVIGIVAGWLGAAVKEYLKNRKVKEGQQHRISEAIAALDLKERERIDAKQEQFVEMVRDLHAQQTQNMQAIINSQQAIIQNQSEGMKLKDSEIEKRGLQMAEMQKQLLSQGMRRELDKA